MRRHTIRLILFSIIALFHLALSNEKKDGDNEDEDEIIEPPSINYDKFAKDADKESNFIESPLVCGDFYELTAITADGNPYSFEKLRGKITLVVNIASQYGLMDRTYFDLVNLQQAYSPTRLFNVVAFPCFEFVNSGAPVLSTTVRQFLIDNYGANFAIFDTVHCQGPEISEVFRFLSHEAKTNVPLWNFWKFLIGPDGHLVTLMSSQQTVSGLSKRIEEIMHEIIVQHREEL